MKSYADDGTLEHGILNGQGRIVFEAFQYEQDTTSCFFMQTTVRTISREKQTKSSPLEMLTI